MGCCEIYVVIVKREVEDARDGVRQQRLDSV